MSKATRGARTSSSQPNIPSAASTSVAATQTLERRKMPARTGTDPRFLAFAAAMFKIGDSTKAYLASHPRCKSARQAKERGRALCQLPEVQLELQRLRTQSLDRSAESDASVSSDSDADRVAWENELNLLAYSKTNLKKVPVKEKMSALRTLGESRGYLKAPAQSGSGIRATFNFRIPGMSDVPGSPRRPESTITVDVGTDQGAIGGHAAYPADNCLRPLANADGADNKHDEAEADEIAKPGKRRLFDTSNT